MNQVSNDQIRQIVRSTYKEIACRRGRSRDWRGYDLGNGEFNEAFWVLRSGGRLAISDIVTTAELPAEIINDLGMIYSSCISGASSVEEVKAVLTQSGFTNVVVEPKDDSIP